jgi:peptide/nickel transport system substrate-binding protein
VPEGVVSGTDLGAQDIVRSLSLEGLTQLSQDGRALPRLAERWAWERDGRSLRIVLRANVKLHDGTPLTAQLAADLVREAVARPSNRLQLMSLGDIIDVRPESDREIVVDLSRRSAFLPEDLELPLAVGPERIGTGPYRLAVREPSQIVLRRFEHYYAGMPHIEEVVIKTGVARRATWASLLRGDVDMVTDVPPDAVEFVENRDVDVISHGRRYQIPVAFNSRRPPFNSPLVRRALNYAVDRDALVRDVLKGHGRPSTGPLWPQHWAYDGAVSPYTFDPGLATSLLESGGFRIDAQIGRPNTRFSFSCLIPANFGLIERLGLEVQRQLYNIGVDMQFDVVPVQEFDRRIRDGRFQAILVDMVSGPSFGRSYLFWASAASFKGLNVFGYENPEAERLFSVLRTSINEAAVRSATRNLQRVLLDDPPALFLVWTDRSRAVRRDFQVIRDPDGDPVSTIWRWAAADQTTQ